MVYKKDIECWFLQRLGLAVTIDSIVYFIKTNNSPISNLIVSTVVSFCATHIKGFSFAETVNVQQGKQTHFQALIKEKRSLVILLIYEHSARWDKRHIKLHV